MKESRPSDLVPFLKRVSVFSELNDSALAVLARVSQIKSMRKGTVLFSQDDPGTAAFVVRSGSVAILLATLDGRELVINEMHSGDCFGELALLTG